MLPVQTALDAVWGGEGSRATYPSQRRNVSAVGHCPSLEIFSREEAEVARFCFPLAKAP